MLYREPSGAMKCKTRKNTKLICVMTLLCLPFVYYQYKPTVQNNSTKSLAWFLSACVPTFGAPTHGF